MSEQPQNPDGGPSVGPEQAPPTINTSPTPADGPQDVDQNFNYEVAETTTNEEDDADPDAGLS